MGKVTKDTIGWIGTACLCTLGSPYNNGTLPGEFYYSHYSITPLALLLSSSPVTNTYLIVEVLCTAITDEGSRKLPKRPEIVNLLTSVNKPQYCQSYLATQDCLKAVIIPL